ncbi:hypothetical protein Tco_0434956 [Tanacetum coccineum]
MIGGSFQRRNNAQIDEDHFGSDWMPQTREQDLQKSRTTKKTSSGGPLKKLGLMRLSIRSWVTEWKGLPLLLLALKQSMTVKSEGSEGFHQILDFRNASHIHYGLETSANESQLTLQLLEQVKTITEASLRRHLKLEDNGGVTTLPNSEIFEHRALWNEAVPMPHESPLHSVHSLVRDEGSLSLNELIDLCTSLSKKVEVKKLEQKVKTTKARRRARIILSEDEVDVEDPSKQMRSLIEELDMDAGISLVPLHAADEGRNDDTRIYDQPAQQLGVFSAATTLADAAKRRRSVETAQTYTKRRKSVSTGSSRVSTASKTVSTAGVKAKDKGKAIMQESESPKKVKKRVQVQMSMDEELAKKVFEDEQAKAMAEQEQEQERINFEAALEL